MGLDAARIRALPIFSELSDEQAERVAAWCEEREVSAGARPAAEGASGYAFFLIEHGTAEVTKDGVGVATLGPGDFFGEMALLGEGGRRLASVVATSPMRLAVMFGTEFRRMEAECPEVAGRLRLAMEQRAAQLREA
jgi:CRP-like cAMP-binding protein